MFDPLPFLIFALILGLSGWGMTALTRAATRGLAAMSDLRRLCIALPQAGYAIWVAVLVIGLMVDPTSHNLWPLEMVFVLLLWLAWVAVLAVGVGLWRLVVRRPG